MGIRRTLVGRILEQDMRHSWRPRFLFFLPSNRHDHSFHPERLGSVCRRISSHDGNRGVSSQRPGASGGVGVLAAAGRHTSISRECALLSTRQRSLSTYYEFAGGHSWTITAASSLTTVQAVGASFWPAETARACFR